MRIITTSVLAAMAGLGLLCAPAVAGTYSVTLNGLEIGVDRGTGSIVRLAHTSTGEILAAPAESAGLLDVALPVPEFVPMRLASRFSKARVTEEPDGLTIAWDRLGPSRSGVTLPPGDVSAQVRIRSAGDGRSVIMTCRIENNSGAQISQILFPDLQGLQAFEGIERTRLRLARDVVYPFVEPTQPPDSSPFYPLRTQWKQYAPGGYYAQNALRWIDYGGFKGGLSVFQKRWGGGERPGVLTYRSEAEPTTLRLAWQSKAAVPPGKVWESEEYWLTPHEGGWAKGIEVFRNYVTQVNPPWELPKHVRDGLGFRSIWMTQHTEPDPARVEFRFTDLARVAKDASDHGLDELVPWCMAEFFDMPIQLRSVLGTPEELAAGMRAARELGVNVAPFISIQWVVKDLAQRYEVKPAPAAWVYHPELIPNYKAYYLGASYPVRFWDAAKIPSNNKLWREDALKSIQDWMDNKGVYSFCYDVFEPVAVQNGKPDIVALADEVRRRARAADPESTFSGESTHAGNLEYESMVLDYTWNWIDYTDSAPIRNVLRAPRLNCNVESSARVVKKAFCDGLYINAQPRKPDGPNGTALIAEKPELAAALKECAKLRKQFLSYFVDGTFIGDSVLCEPSQGFVRGYQLGNRLLLIVLNDSEKQQKIVAKSDLGVWLPQAGRYLVRAYDSSGKLVRSTDCAGPELVISTRALRPTELALFEIEAPKTKEGQ